MNEGLPLLVLALGLAATVLIFWRAILFCFAVVFLGVFMVGLLQVVGWVHSLS